MKYEIRSFRPYLDDLELKPGSDPTDPDLEPVNAQAIYIYQHREEFFNEVESKMLKKIVQDFDFVMKKGWAEDISEYDFCHGHISGRSKKPIFNMDDLFSADNVLVLYHTHEVWKTHPTKNVLSSLKSPPSTVQPEPEKYSVDTRDLRLLDYADVHFKMTGDGPHKLGNGTKLDVWGVLDKVLLWRHLQRKTHRVYDHTK